MFLIVLFEKIKMRISLDIDSISITSVFSGDVEHSHCR